MKIAFILFDKMTTLDFVGFYDAITRLRILNLMEDVTWDVCSTQSEVTDELGITMRIEHVSPDLSKYDLIFVPGGWGTRKLRNDVEFISWLKTASTAKYKVSVCTGALLLGAAGFLTGKRATTNASAYELLEPYCEEVVRARIVRDGNIFTGGGVATSIDLGLYLLEFFTDAETVEKIQKSMDYPYFQAGKQGFDYIV